MANEVLKNSYELRVKGLNERLTKIEELLGDHNQRFTDTDCTNWGFIGDIEFANEKLDFIIAKIKSA